MIDASSMARVRIADPRPVRTGRGYGGVMAIRVALGEDSLIVREGVHQLLAVDPAVEIVASVGDLDSLREACARHRPDVVLTDIRMPPTNTDEGIRLAGELRETHPGIGVVVLSQFSDPIYALALLDRGSDGRGYLLKERVHNRAELMAAIRAVADGGSLIDPKIVEALVFARSRAERSPLNELTAREREVLSEIAQGKSNTAIAECLYLTKRAVEKHINSIFLKLGLADAEDVSKRVKAALMFLSDADGVEAVNAAR
jgi:DNA-binding NarL/FixJ family response regulator